MQGAILLLFGIAFSKVSGNDFEGIFSSRYAQVKPKRCTYMRTHDMLAADCYDLKLTQIPSALRSNIEVLDVSHNRIRELLNASFVNYPSLAILYLSDNSISYIEPGAFLPLEDLKVLDLTLNSVIFVPDGLENLPVLRKLMLGSNPLMEVVFPRMIPSLQYLSLSKCKLKRFPDLTSLPGLLQLNLSDNQIQHVDIHHVAPTCRLQLLDLSGNPRLFGEKKCDCRILVTWIKRRHGDQFRLIPGIDSVCENGTAGKIGFDDRDLCFDNETRLILEESDLLARSCETEVMKYGSGPLRLRGSLTWILLAAGISGFLLILYLSVHCMRRKKKKTTTRQSERGIQDRGKGWRT